MKLGVGEQRLAVVLHRIVVDPVENRPVVEPRAGHAHGVEIVSAQGEVEQTVGELRVKANLLAELVVGRIVPHQVAAVGRALVRDPALEELLVRGDRRQADGVAGFPADRARDRFEVALVFRLLAPAEIARVGAVIDIRTRIAEPRIDPFDQLDGRRLAAVTREHAREDDLESV